jgi:hypothetical protein
VILLPLIDGKLQGHVVMGNRSQINKMRESCYAVVGKKYGMELTKRDKLDIVKTKQIASEAVDKIVANPKLLNDMEIKDELLAVIEKIPISLLVSLAMLNARSHLNLENKHSWAL